MAPTRATQAFVPIKEVRDGVVVLKDNSLRGVLLASSLNFGLKSVDEQRGIILQFQNLLNTVEFPVQFYIQSRERDMRPYIALLEERLKDQTIDLIKTQITEYIEFIKDFSANVNIMAKNFFIIVPYSLSVVARHGGASTIMSTLLSKRQKLETTQHQAFEERVSQLEQRMSVVEQGLSRTGVRSVRLGTEELVELYYKIFNPSDLEKPIQLEQNV